MAVSLVATSSYLPEKIVANDFFVTEGASDDHPMFKGTNLRHHIALGETVTDMVERAPIGLMQSLNLNPKTDIDILLTNVTCLDTPFFGPGAEIAHRLGADPHWIIDHQNGGCVSLQLPPEQQIQTFADHGNLFGAAIPICLTKGVEDGAIQKGDRLMLAGFSHAGDYAAASIVHWHGKG